MGFARAGWKANAANRFEDAKGNCISLADLSETALSKRMLKDLMHIDIRDAMSSVFDRHPENQDLEHSFRHRPWLEPVQQLTQTRTKRGLQPRQARTLCKLFSGGIVTGMTLHKWGYATTGKCTLCSAAADTLEHRIFECPEQGTTARARYPRWIQELASASLSGSCGSGLLRPICCSL